MTRSRLCLALASAACTLLAVLPQHARAASAVVNPTPAGGSASAALDFRITVPRILYLQVGTGTNFTNVATVDLIDITLPAAVAIGGGTQAASAASGDQGNGAVTVRVFGNGTTGNISLNSATTGPIGNGAGQSIGWGAISVVAAALPAAAATAGFTNGAITHPAFNTTAAGGNGTATTLTPVGGLVRQEGMWTYSYNNAAAVPAGTYGGVNVNNSRVTYTATMP